MNTDILVQLLQHSFHIGVGATATFLETLQDPLKRQEALSDLQAQWQQRAEEWATKGEITEQEARRLIEVWLDRQKATSQAASSPSERSTASPVRNSNLQTEIEELTQQVTTLRAELEKLRQGKESQN